MKAASLPLSPFLLGWLPGREVGAEGAFFLSLRSTCAAVPRRRVAKGRREGLALLADGALSEISWIGKIGRGMRERGQETKGKKGSRNRLLL